MSTPSRRAQPLGKASRPRQASRAGLEPTGARIAGSCAARTALPTARSARLVPLRPRTRSQDRSVPRRPRRPTIGAGPQRRHQQREIFTSLLRRCSGHLTLSRRAAGIGQERPLEPARRDDRICVSVARYRTRASSGRPGALRRRAPLRTGRARFRASGSSKPWWLAGGVAVEVDETGFGGVRAGCVPDDVDRLASGGQPVLPVAWGLWAVLVGEQDAVADRAAPVLGLVSAQGGEVDRQRRFASSPPAD